MLSRLQNQKISIKGIVVQTLFLLIGLIFSYLLFQQVSFNLKSQGIASGFEFLSLKSGFSIIQTLISYDEYSSNGRAFVVALLNTLLVTIVGIGLASFLGFAIGLAKLSDNWLLSKIAGFYIQSFRNIPLLLQIYFWYFVALRSLPHPRQSHILLDLCFLNNRGLYLPLPPTSSINFVTLSFACIFILSMSKRTRVWIKLSLLLATIIILINANFWLKGISYPELTGFNVTGGLVIIPELSALTLALSMYTAAFIAEIVRAGIQSVDKGQIEAAKALGMNQRQTLKLIIIPQAFRVIIPPLTSQYMNLGKNSSLAAAIGYPEVVAVFTGTILNQTGQAVEIIFMTMLVYLSMNILIALIMSQINKRVKI